MILRFNVHWVLLLMITLVETLVFCHYSTVFGTILGLFQYLPSILIFGSFFWSLKNRDPFFLSLGLVLKISWIVSILLKFFLFPVIIGSNITVSNATLPLLNVDPKCDSYVPSLIGYVAQLLFSSNNGKVFLGTEFPHIDILQTGIYDGYIMSYLIWWGFPPPLMVVVGLSLISFVPWSFISAGYTSAPTIIVSFIFGVLIGMGGLAISNAIFKFFKEKEKGCCYGFWCGSKNSQDDENLFSYSNNYQ
jgi:hypothetical protein